MAQKDMPSARGLLAGFFLVFAAQAGAQVTETPIAFDSAGRVRALTPALVTRLGLTAPAWPVSGAFREARLFSVSSGGTVLTVEREDRSVERYAIDDIATLRAAVDAAIARTGAIATDEGSFEVSTSARGHFLRRQLALSWGLYGPLLGSLVDDGSVASAIVLASVPASFFIVHKISRNTPITRAQSSLALDGALRGWAAGAGAWYAITGESAEKKPARLVGLASAIGGSAYAFKRSRGWTDGEVGSTTLASTLSALTALGLIGSTMQLDSTSTRGVVAALVASGAAGYAIGPRYARQPGYAATGGDVSLISLGSTLGAMTAVIPIVEADIDSHVGFAVMTAGLVGGSFAAHRLFVTPFDHSSTDATLTWLGAGAGALAGSAVVVLAEPAAAGTLTLVTAGAIVGSIAGHRVANPPRARSRAAMGNQSPATGSPRLSFDLTSLAAAAAGVRGNHAVLSLRF